MASLVAFRLYITKQTRHEKNVCLTRPLRLAWIWPSRNASSHYTPRSFSVSVMNSGVFLMSYWYTVFPFPRYVGLDISSLNCSFHFFLHSCSLVMCVCRWCASVRLNTCKYKKLAQMSQSVPMQKIIYNFVDHHKNRRLREAVAQSSNPPIKEDGKLNAKICMKGRD